MTTQNQQRPLPDLGVRHLDVHARRGHRRRTARAEHVGGAVEQLPTPLGDLRGVDFELLGDLGDRLVVLHRRKGHFGLEPRRVVAADPLAYVCS